MAPGIQDPRMVSVQPRLRYNTIGGVNGPLVVLDNVRSLYLDRTIGLTIC
jgi:V-type H+-transporting ATPase subunit B